MKYVMRMMVVGLLVAVAVSMVACNAIGGLGKDIQNGAEATRNALTTQPSK